VECSGRIAVTDAGRRGQRDSTAVAAAQLLPDRADAGLDDLRRLRAVDPDAFLAVRPRFFESGKKWWPTAPAPARLEPSVEPGAAARQARAPQPQEEGRPPAGGCEAARPAQCCRSHATACRERASYQGRITSRHSASSSRAREQRFDDHRAGGGGRERSGGVECRDRVDHGSAATTMRCASRAARASTGSGTGSRCRSTASRAR